MGDAGLASATGRVDGERCFSRGRQEGISERQGKNEAFPDPPSANYHSNETNGRLAGCRREACRLKVEARWSMPSSQPGPEVELIAHSLTRYLDEEVSSEQAGQGVRYAIAEPIKEVEEAKRVKQSRP